MAVLALVQPNGLLMKVHRVVGVPCRRHLDLNGQSPRVEERGVGEEGAVHTDDDGRTGDRKDLMAKVNGAKVHLDEGQAAGPREVVQCLRHVLVVAQLSGAHAPAQQQRRRHLRRSDAARPVGEVPQRVRALGGARPQAQLAGHGLEAHWLPAPGPLDGQALPPGHVTLDDPPAPLVHVRRLRGAVEEHARGRLHARPVLCGAQPLREEARVAGKVRHVGRGAKVGACKVLVEEDPDALAPRDVARQLLEVDPAIGSGGEGAVGREVDLERHALVPPARQHHGVAAASAADLQRSPLHTARHGGAQFLRGPPVRAEVQREVGHRTPQHAELTAVPANVRRGVDLFHREERRPRDP
mmetsp:Transcript_72910/g.225470  ORF Transcript_72910/g.225470 Transcript_72910/m.225470 type:complete len:355 (+) Transcript_72910:250-1314(+)